MYCMMHEYFIKHFASVSKLYRRICSHFFFRYCIVVWELRFDVRKYACAFTRCVFIPTYSHASHSTLWMYLFFRILRRTVYMYWQPRATTPRFNTFTSAESVRLEQASVRWQTWNMETMKHASFSPYTLDTSTCDNRLNKKWWMKKKKRKTIHAKKICITRSTILFFFTEKNMVYALGCHDGTDRNVYKIR